MTLVALVSISLLFNFFIKTTTLTQAHCLPDQRHALIQLKKDFDTTELSSWKGSTNCCIWYGITCDEQTGMVTAIDLSGRSLSGELNPALFNLSSLRYINLADNNFYNITLPQTGFERLANLTHLDLSFSGFAGQVPISISALTNLISLDLSYNTLYLHDTGLKTLLKNLTKLQVLRLDNVDISLNGSEWGSAVFQVGPTLLNLSMVDCGLRGNFPDEIFHLTNITELDLSFNSRLSGQLPKFTKQSFLQSLSLAYLSLLDLSNCSFNGEVPPSITNQTRLEYLDLSSNRLTGTMPMNLFSHPSLKSLYLSRNQLSGYLPELSNGSSILEFINLDYNNLQGQLPISIFSSPQLIELNLASNNFNGTLNFAIMNHHKNLDAMDLSNNKIDGVIPNWLCSKSSITSLNLSHNLFTKIERDAHFTSLDSLKYLDIHSNRISGSVPLLPPGIKYADCSSNYFFLFPTYFVSSFFYLSLSNNSLTGEIPPSICNATSLQVLDLSNNDLTGTMPSCLLEDAEFRVVLDLKSNQLSGPLPQNISQGCKLRTIDLRGNKINGSLPQSLMNCNLLEVLDLGNNQIVDRFPFWLGNLENLSVLVLRSNQFFGTVSNMEAKTTTNNSLFPTLKVFDLSSNHFRGIIPKIVFENMKAMVTNSDSSKFQFASSISYGPLRRDVPAFIGGPYVPSFDGMRYYRNSIKVIWKGQEMEIENTLSIFSSFDLSQNRFLGEIPEEIGQLTSLDVLNLSHNALTGPIPSKFANLHQLQSLDLSFNHLSGHIPQELTSLTFLSALNLSYNNMVGEIPQARQFSTFSNASYLGNPGLCGSPLSMQCETTPSNQGFNNKGFSSKSSTDIIGLSVSIGVGLGVGFASVIWALVSWKKGREWFNFIVDRFYFRYWH